MKNGSLQLFYALIIIVLIILTVSFVRYLLMREYYVDLEKEKLEKERIDKLFSIRVNNTSVEYMNKIRGMLEWNGTS